MFHLNYISYWYNGRANAGTSSTAYKYYAGEPGSDNVLLMLGITSRHFISWEIYYLINSVTPPHMC